MTNWQLRIPGRIFEAFAERAIGHADRDSDLDLCDALSRAILKRRGAGHSVFVRLTPAQVDRLSYWISDRDPKPLRDYAESMRKAAAETERVEPAST